MKLPYTICYVSKSKPDLSESQIKDIFTHASTVNNKCDVRGILLHSLGNFFQVLEGDEKYLIDLYENKIKKDPRHENIYEVYHKKTAKPVFTNYSSQFNIVEDSEQLEAIQVYLEENKISSTTSDKLSRLLRPFMLID